VMTSARRTSGWNTSTRRVVMTSAGRTSASGVGPVSSSSENRVAEEIEHYRFYRRRTHY
jgi:hypothetical protein